MNANVVMSLMYTILVTGIFRSNWCTKFQCIVLRKFQCIVLFHVM